MSRGAKPGQNRFEASQKQSQQFRIDRIKNELIPKLKSLAGKVSFDGITPYSRFCAELYNDGLPVNEKQMGYRTFVQNSAYWSLVGPLYFKHWDTSSDSELRKERFLSKLAVKRANTLEVEVSNLRLENEALRSSLRHHGASLPKPSVPVEIGSEISDLTLMFDKTCRALKLVLDASEGTFAADLEAVKITCAFNTLEPIEGLVPKSVAEPFITWLKNRGKS